MTTMMQMSIGTGTYGDPINAPCNTVQSRAFGPPHTITVSG